MKKKNLILAALLVSLCFLLFIASVQNTAAAIFMNKKSSLCSTSAVLSMEPDSPAVFKYVEQMPEFKGNFTEWVKENLRYPEKAQKKKKEGKVLVQFTVWKDGSVGNATIIRSSGTPELDEEALRIISIMPDWMPGRQNDVAVATFFTLPLTFRLK